MRMNYSHSYTFLNGNFTIFPFDLYYCEGVGTSSRCGDTYHGPRPFSEVEAYNVAKYLFKNRKNLIGYMDIHAYSQLWMTPWGYKREYPSDNGEQVKTSDRECIPNYYT